MQSLSFKDLLATIYTQDQLKHSKRSYTPLIELENSLATLNMIGEDAAVWCPSTLEEPVKRSLVRADLRDGVGQCNGLDLHLRGGKEDGEDRENRKLHCRCLGRVRAV